MADVALLASQAGEAPIGYQVPGAQEIILKSITASFDGTGASGDFLPVLQIVAPNGAVLASCPVSTQVAAGGSADVSWFPRGGVATSSAAGGIQFDTDNEGGWLDVTTNDLDANGFGFDLKNAAAGPALIESPGGDLSLQGAEGNIANLNADGSILLETDGASANPNIALDAVGQLTLEGDVGLNVIAGGVVGNQVTIDNSGTTLYLLPDADSEGFAVRDGSGVRQFIFVVQHNFEGVGDIVTVRDLAGNDLFQVWDDGTLHGKTGGSLVFDL